MPIRLRPARRSPRPVSPSIESFERRLLFAIDVTIGTGQPAQALVFSDADGTTAQIRAAGGTATITFDAPDVAQSTTGRLVTVTGTAVTMTRMTIQGDHPNVTVRTTGGDGTVTLPSVTAQQFVRGFSGRGVVLNGFTLFADGVGRLDVAGAQGASINIGGTGQTSPPEASISIANVSGTAIHSQFPVRLLRVGRWSAGTPGQSNQLAAPRVNSLQCAGDFTPDLFIGGQDTGRPALGNARILGALASGAWNVAGKTSRVAAASVGSEWDGTFGDVASFATTGDLAGTVSANSINSLAANTITGANIALARPFGQQPGAALNRLNVRGAITNTRIQSDSDIGTVSAASMTNSSIFAGVANGGGGGSARNLPTDATAFVSAATIRSVTLRRSATANYTASNVAASTIGRFSGGTVHVTNTGQQFGLAAQTIGSVSGTRDDTGESARAVRLTEPSDGIDLGDFEVRVF
jgi:hypothetical protein